MRCVLSWAAGLILIFLSLQAGAAATGDRLALVIGNDGYSIAPPLNNAVADAAAIGGKLTGLGFKVTAAQNLDFRATNRMLSSFEASVTPGATVFVYFAGHGVSMGGVNYLLPTDIERPEPGAESLIKAESYSVDDLIHRLQARGPASLIMVIDACRNNPFEAIGTRGIGADRGLARVDAPTGVFVLFSAGAGQTALDSLGDTDTVKNSVFTRVLMKYLGEPGLSHILLAKRVQTEVKALAETSKHVQQPAFYDQIDGEIVLNPGTETQKPQQDASLPAAKDKPAKDSPKTKPRFGVVLRELTDEEASQRGIHPAKGALVVNVAPESLAAEAGIEKDDVLVKFGDRTIWQMRDFMYWLVDTPGGTTLPITYWRQGREITASVTLGPLPEGPLLYSPADPLGKLVGVKVADMTPELRERYGIVGAERGVVVIDNSEADAGMKARFVPGDVVYEVGARKVSSMQDIAERLTMLQRGGAIGVGVGFTSSGPKGGEKRFLLTFK